MEREGKEGRGRGREGKGTSVAPQPPKAGDATVAHVTCSLAADVPRMERKILHINRNVIRH